MKHGFLKLAPCGLLGIALILFSGAAMALGLGEIRVKSQPGQPLIAEIPVISNEPGELEQLRAQLASPATFERVGLARPTGLISGLDFAIALSDEGKPIIRVTSTEPVQVDAVNFLIEVDWGQGRLVREYSALVSAPGALAVANQPIIDAPVPPPSNVILREPEPVAAAPIAPVPARESLQPDTAVAPAPVARTEPPAAAPAPIPAVTSGDIQVQRGQTLSQIARDLGQGYHLDQTMLALLRANPDAFINNNINLLKQGTVLRVPQSAELAQLGEAEATALVRDQMAEWRQARRPIPQPAEVGAPVAAATQAPAATGAAARVAEARLEIAPPAASAANQAGTESGIDAEGEGDMLANEQLTLTKEELAARESEVQELRTQVAELESLKQQQAKLIAMKDSELAAAQQRLAQSQGDASQPLWLWAGLGLLVAGLVVAWLIGRRRKPVLSAPSRSGYDSAAMAAAVPSAEATVDIPVQPHFDDEVPATLPEEDEAPAAEAPAAQPWTTAAVKPTWHTGALNVAPLNAAPAGRERLELAIAYLDLGDVEAARDLLNEVIAGGDDAARNEATQLLREIG